MTTETLTVVKDYPPNFAQIREAGFLPPPNAIFCYGWTVFAPKLVGDLHQSLVAHETVHAINMTGGGHYNFTPETWWEAYLNTPTFRLTEEVLAHRAEYQWWAAHVPNRHTRRAKLKEITNRLAGPLYGRMITKKDAKWAISGTMKDFTDAGS